MKSFQAYDVRATPCPSRSSEEQQPGSVQCGDGRKLARRRLLQRGLGEGVAVGVRLFSEARLAVLSTR